MWVRLALLGHPEVVMAFFYQADVVDESKRPFSILKISFTIVPRLLSP